MLFKRLPGLIALFVGFLCEAQSWPQPPCAGSAEPAYPALDAPPVVKVWNSAAVGQSWKPPVCTGWEAVDVSTVVATAARLRFSGGAEGLRRRIGAISETAGTLYWSTAQKRWQKLILEAHASATSDSDQARPDFALAEIAEGRTLFFEQEDNLFGNVTYRMHIRKASPAAIVFDVENTTALRYLTIPVFQPGQAQSIYYLDKESAEVWRYYAIARTVGKAGTLLSGHESSAINRAVALYRRLAGIPGDLEPPAAR
jgi:hypothetical protein